MSLVAGTTGIASRSSPDRGEGDAGQPSTTSSRFARAFTAGAANPFGADPTCSWAEEHVRCSSALCASWQILEYRSFHRVERAARVGTFALQARDFECSACFGELYVGTTMTRTRVGLRGSLHRRSAPRALCRGSGRGGAGAGAALISACGTCVLNGSPVEDAFGKASA